MRDLKFEDSADRREAKADIAELIIAERLARDDGDCCQASGVIWGS